MFRCMSCGKELVWVGAFTTKEMYGEEKPEGVTGIYTCGDCGLDYEISTFEESDEIEVKLYEVEE